MNDRVMVDEQPIKNTRPTAIFAGNRWISITWLLALPLLLLLPSIQSFPYPSAEAEFSDMVISHYPNAIYLKQSITRWGEIPLWSGSILSGYPLAADPLSGIWYPPGWLALVLPLPLGFNLLVGLHLVWGGYGLFCLMRQEGLGTYAALSAGLSFAMLPKLFAHYGAGHLTLLYAIPWTPWLLVTQRRQTKINGLIKIPPGLVLGLILLADVRWGAFALLTWWAYSAVNRTAGWRAVLKGLVIQTILGFLLAALLLVPLVEFTQLSTRAELTTADVLNFSLPLGNLLGLVYPNPGTIHEWVLYSGGMVILLALTGILISRAKRQKYFWGMLCLAGLLAAAGSQIPGADRVAALPGVSWLRVPARGLFLTGMGAAALAGYGVEAIIPDLAGGRAKLLSLGMFAAAVFSILLLGGVYLVSGELPRDLLWGTATILVSVTWIWLGMQEKMPVKVWLVGVLLILAFDLSIFNLNVFAGKDRQSVLAERARIAEFIASNEENGRTYSPSYSLPQQTSAQYGLRMADGVDPLQLASYAEFMEQASGVPREGYSVSIPPFSNGKPATDNHRYTPDAGQLGLLNVGYVVSDFPLITEGLTPAAEFEGVIIYQNEKNRFPAWVEAVTTTGDQEDHPAQILERSANQLKIKAEGPGNLVISEILYPGWEARMDGRVVEISRQHQVLMGVEIGPGVHEVLLQFRPKSVVLGLVLSGLGVLFLIWLLWRSRDQEQLGA